MSPKRICLRGGTDLNDAIYVGRPSKYGNPWILVTEKDRPEVLRKYEEYLNQILNQNPDFLFELKGRDLACWCRLDKRCHADILLEYANK